MATRNCILISGVLLHKGEPQNIRVCWEATNQAPRVEAAIPSHIGQERGYQCS